MTVTTCAVTGAAGLIGGAIVDLMARRGARVLALDHNWSNEASPGPAIDRYTVDVADEQAVARTFADITQTVDGGLDGLVHCAGIADPETGPVERLALADWRKVVDSHLTGAFLCARAAIPLLRASRGAIIHVASTRALQSEPDTEAYAAAKGGLVALTHALAVSLGPEIRVNCISPGWIAAEDAELSEEDHDQHPVGRVGRPADIAHAVDYLLGDTAGFITGQQLVIDGGMTRRMIYR